MAQTVQIFDAKLQETVPHTVRIDANGEFLFESPSGRFFKLPADTDPADFEKHFAAHEEANVGQVSLEEQEAKLEAYFASKETPEVVEEKTS